MALVAAESKTSIGPQAAQPELDEKKRFTYNDLPDYTVQSVIGLSQKWIEDDQDIADMPNRLRRFVLYYFMALDTFGALDRIKLPACVVSAIRAKYPQDLGDNGYKGHLNVQSD